MYKVYLIPSGLDSEIIRPVVCCVVCCFRDKIIEPMLVRPDGRLEPLCGRMRNDTLKEEEEEEVEDEEEDADCNDLD